MMVLLIALFALPARAAQNVPSDLYLAYYKNDVWNYSIFEKDASSKVFTCTHNFASGETFYVVKTPNAAAEPSKNSNMYEASDCDLTDGTSRDVYLYGDSKKAYVNKSSAGLYTVKVDFSSVDEPYKLSFSSAITEPTYTVSIVGNVGQDSSTDTGTNLSYVGNGIYSGEVDLQGTRYFRVIIDGSKFGPNRDNSDKSVAEGTTETIFMNKDLRAFQAPLLNKKYFVLVDVYNNTVSISTDVYLVGDVTGGWDTSHGWKFETTDGVTYTLTGKKMSANKFKLLTSTNTWYGDGNTSITVPYINKPLSTPGGDMKLSSSADNVNITFNLSTKAFSISGGSTPTPSASYRLKTSENGWKTTIDLTDDDNDGTYSCTMTNPAEGLQFMVQMNGTDHLWPTSAVTYSGGEQTINLGTTSGNNITMGSGLSGKYTITLDPDAKTLTISGTAVASNDLAIGFGEYTYASSDNLWNGSEQKYNTYTITGKGGAKFRIYDSNGKSYGPSMDTDIENGKTYSDIGENTNYFVVPNDGRDYVVAINSFDGSKVSFSVTRAAVVGKELAIAGSAVGTGYNYSSGHNIWNSETETYDSYIIDTQSQSGDTYVKFYSTSNPYGPSEGDGKELEVGTLTGKILDNGSWKVAKGKKFKVTVLEFDPTNDTTPLTIKVEEVKPKVALVTDRTANGSWTFANGIALEQGQQANVQTFADANVYFRFIDENGTNYYPTTNNTTITDGDYTTEQKAASTSNAYMLPKHAGDVYVTITEFSVGNYVKFSVNGVTDLYFASSKDWGLNPTTKMTRVDANTFVYRIDNVDVSTLTTYNNGNVLEFGIARDKNADGTQDEWYWGSKSENRFEEAGSYERNLYSGGDNNSNFISTVSGNYVFTVTVNNSGVPQKVVIDIDGGEASHKPYYFVGDMNDWFSKEFTDPTAPQGMDKDVMNANKKNWEFTFINEIPDRGELGKGWYELDIDCLTGQFQIFDGTDAMWNGDVYSHDPYVRGYGNNGGKDHNSFKAYINRPISKAMISDGTVMTTTTNKATTTTEAKPAIRRSQGSNFHLGCNAVRNAKIYFLPGNDPKLIVSGTPEDYYIFYSKANKNEDTSDGKVTAQIVNGKPNTNNYYLPGVKYDNVALPNYINEDSNNNTAAHMNMEGGIDLVEFDFSAENIETTFDSDAFRSMFNTASVGGMTLDDFKNNLKNNQKLPNGISLTGRTTVYVQKIPNGFEYPAGRKYALQFINAFSSSDKGVLTPVAASNLYFFNDAIHVHFNIDNYEKGAQEKNRFVKMYYRIYTYDKNYNTIVIDSDNGTTSQIHSVGEEIGLTAESTTKDRGWVALNEKKAPSDWGGLVTDTGHSNLEAWNVAWVNNNRKHIDSKYGNCYIQFKIETGPNPSQASAANRANAEESDHGTLYIPERALIRNTPEFYTFNGKDLYVALEGGYTTTGVEDVFEDQIVEEGVDAEPIFFNLQGQRVVNPEKGMYIVVKGNKTYKVMIK